MTIVSDLTSRRLSGWCDLPCSPIASSIARRWVSAMLASWDLSLCAADEATIAELTSELVTNAVQHAAPPARGSSGIRINVRVGDTTVWLAVCDSDPTLPTQRAPDFFSESGRGLFLVEAQADQWGAVQHEAGKYVWFSLECLGGARRAGEVPTGRTFAERSPSGATNTKENPPCPPSSFLTTSAAPGRTA
ncbi:anti-sigma regulatory factor (Ser/Thr protein kinase) [Nonomuraea polychroma]|uniref:Anti-sigma regulatory factor (Ser/Thr protein kinase) n=1 Tax=Nonomuraea polychroma TaxID=46176 RepID=A0A438M8D6_9ACTN|nr:ATP-binding protein [Nonomuraea polychroma]RVX41957.1 anti-sigma regulatory factor (Ser/Thr protein kinase) [Nonomuraea polychroma]